MTDLVVESRKLVTELVSQNNDTKELHLLQKLLDVYSTSKNTDAQLELTSCLVNVNLEDNKSCLLLDQFLEYVFKQRFKWTEDNSVKEPDKSFVYPSSNKSKICALLDQIIQFLCNETIYKESLQSYHHLYQKVSSLPIVRSQLGSHVMLWIANTTVNINTTDIYHYIQDVLLSIITDIWSTIRKSGCSRLSLIIQKLEEDNIKILFNSLGQICVNPSSIWQSIDGAILGISVILNYYVSNSKPVPEYIQTQLLSTVFNLIRHPQLSIRETAVKALSIYISGCTEDKMASTFQQVLSLLTNQQNGSEEMQVENLIEAYQAEGILKICSSMIKVLPLPYMLAEWPTYLTVFLSYLSHEASTVRQSASLVFKQLLFKSDSNPVLLKVILSKLTDDWRPTCCQLSPESTTGNTVKEWQSKEGRLFVYEIVSEYLVKNHWLMTFGPLQPTKHGELRRLSTSAISTSILEKGENLTPIWRDMVSELTDKSLLQQTYLYDQFAAQQSLPNLELIFLQQCCGMFEGGPTSTKTIDSSWLKNIRVKSFNELLQTMLYQSMECLLDNQWELKRIAQQVLPILSEVIRWYDIELYKMIIQDTLYSDNEVLLYLGTFLLKESLEHSVCLLPLFKQPPKSWKNIDVCVEVIEILITSVKQQIDNYIKHIQTVLTTRTVYDKLSVMAVQIIITINNYFDTSEEQKNKSSLAVYNFWQTLFQFAHPTSQICYVLDKPTTDFKSPYTGYLSCCLVEPDSDIICARQVERHLVTMVYEYLPLYLSQLNSDPRYLPIITHYIGLFVDDSTICKQLIQCLLKLSMVVVEPVISRSISINRKPVYLKCIYYTLKELTAIIAIKTFDSTLLEKNLSVYLVLCRPINPIKHLPNLLKSVCSRLNKGRSYINELSPRSDSIEGIYNSFDLPSPLYQSQLTCLDIENKDITECDMTAMSTECISLNTSFGGKRKTLSLSRDNQMGSEKDEDSDWDSWSEEDEADSTMSDMFGNFLRKLSKAMNKESKEIMKKEIEKLKNMDKEIIDKLMAST